MNDGRIGKKSALKMQAYLVKNSSENKTTKGYFLGAFRISSSIRCFAPYLIWFASVDISSPSHPVYGTLLCQSCFVQVTSNAMCNTRSHIQYELSWHPFYGAKMCLSPFINCLLLPFPNPTTYRLSNLRPINMISSPSPIIPSLLSSFVGT